MSNNIDVTILQQQLAETKAMTHRDALKRGGGGGSSGDMEPRVQRLEDDMKELKGDMKTALKDLSYLRGKVDSLPTTLQLIGFAVAVFVAAGITHWFGALGK